MCKGRKDTLRLTCSDIVIGRQYVTNHILNCFVILKCETNMCSKYQNDMTTNHFYCKNMTY